MGNQADLAAQGHTVAGVNEDLRGTDVDSLTAEARAIECCLSDDDCVTLAAIVLRDGTVSVDQATGRQQIYSTAILQQMLTNLARRVSDLENRVNG